MQILLGIWQKKEKRVNYHICVMFEKYFRNILWQQQMEKSLKRSQHRKLHFAILLNVFYEEQSIFFSIERRLHITSKPSSILSIDLEFHWSTLNCFSSWDSNGCGFLYVVMQCSLYYGISLIFLSYCMFYLLFFVIAITQMLVIEQKNPDGQWPRGSMPK